MSLKLFGVFIKRLATHFDNRYFNGILTQNWIETVSLLVYTPDMDGSIPAENQLTPEVLLSITGGLTKLVFTTRHKCNNAKWTGKQLHLNSEGSQSLTWFFSYIIFFVLFEVHKVLEQRTVCQWYSKAKISNCSQQQTVSGWCNARTCTRPTFFKCGQQKHQIRHQAFIHGYQTETTVFR